MIPYGRQSISQEDIAAASAPLKTDIITRGPSVELFEKEFAEAVGAQYAVAFTSGSTALSAAYFAAKVGPADKVITSPNTFIATTAYASQQGAKIEFVDIDRSSGNFNLEEAVKKFDFRSSRGRLFIVPIHFSGIAIDMQRLSSCVNTPQSVVIEDAAHAIGSCYPSGEKVGSCAYSDMTIFSFHPVKTITTGEGGMVTTNDAVLYSRLTLFRNSGIVREKPALIEAPGPGYYEVQALACNYHMNEMQGALGSSQLKRLIPFVEKRRALVKRYRELLKGKPHVRLFDEVFDERTAYHLFVAQIDFKALKTTRNAVMEKLKEKGIGTQLHYIPLYRHPVYRGAFKDAEELFPEMEKYYEEALTLPLYYDLKLEEVDFVVESLREVREVRGPQF